MQLIFNNLDELNDMLKAMGYVRRDAIGVDLRVSDKMMKDLAESMERGLEREVAASRDVDNLPDDGVPETGASDTLADIQTTKRKRRTKAEIEAEQAAQSTAAIVVATETGNATAPAQVAHNPLDNLKPEPEVIHAGHNDQARAEIAEMAGLFDGSDRLAHLNEGRHFIEAHGFPTYNETLQLADVPANIASHTSEQVSQHRAAMAWKAAQLAGG